jgi:hypothetical protein
MKNWKGAGTGAATGAAAGAALGPWGAVAGGLIGGAMGLFSGGSDDQLSENKELMEYQQKLAQENAAYGMGLQKEMFDYTQSKTDLHAQVEKMKKEGLNVGLLYGGSGAGGSTVGQGQTGTANVQAGGSGAAADRAAMKQAESAQLGMALQLAEIKSRIDVNKSTAEKQEAEAISAKANTEKTLSESETINAKRELEVAFLNEQGLRQWMENTITQYQAGTDFSVKGNKQDSITAFNNPETGWQMAIDYEGGISRTIAANIAKTMAETGNEEAQTLLTNNRAMGYWRELLNGTISANADATRAAAQRLATMWETGEYTNEMTWIKLGAQTVGSLGGLAKSIITKGKGSKK